MQYDEDRKFGTAFRIFTILAIIIAFLDAEQAIIRLRDLWHDDSKKSECASDTNQEDKLC